MLAIDLALLAGGAVLVVLIAGVVGGRIGARGEARRRKLLGARNAAEEKRRLEERCTICSEHVDPETDVWDQGQWWHRTCYREALR